MGLKEATNTIKSRVESMLSRANNGGAWLARVAYPRYQNAQAERFMTQNASQGTTWKKLNPAYQELKLRKFKNSPGAGRFILIASARMVSSIMGRSGTSFVNNAKGLGEHRRLINGNTLEVYTTTPYAKYPNQDRPFMQFNKKFYDGLMAEYKAWITGGQK
jgi:hypothetical protein